LLPQTPYEGAAERSTKVNRETLMKLIAVSCTAMLAIAPATVGFAQDTSYPDRGSIAKTGPAPEKEAPEKGATSASEKGVLGTVLETITGPPLNTKQDAAPTENK
jgi:hypothetical protein